LAHIESPLATPCFEGFDPLTEALGKLDFNSRQR
jgi:hypothetical protein